MAVKPGWEGRFFEDFNVGDVYRCRLGRTVTEADNIWFTLLTNNTNQIHFNNEYGKRTEFGKCLINSALTLAIVGLAGFTFFTGTPPGKNLFTAFWGSSSSWTLAALPMFIWMGEILFRTRLSREMFDGFAPWLGRVPGRLMHVNILGCGVFGSVSGSSAATCATVSKVALPELLKRGYSDEDVKKVIGLNVLRAWRGAEQVAARLQKTRGPSTVTLAALDK